ncbi:MAG: hypothetical protein H0X65_12045 [Gemmatimonadetes bacterium]|nr:hypothetical protein [Gemmatimonadota bacterium]
MRDHQEITAVAPARADVGIGQQDQGVARVDRHLAELGAQLLPRAVDGDDRRLEEGMGRATAPLEVLVLGRAQARRGPA